MKIKTYRVRVYNWYLHFMILPLEGEIIDSNEFDYEDIVDISLIDDGEEGNKVNDVVDLMIKNHENSCL